LALSDTDEPLSFHEDGTLIGWLNSQFQRAEDARRSDEDRMLRAYKNYRGIWSEDNRFTQTEKSRVFIRVTKTKVLAAYGQIIEVVFCGLKCALSVSAALMPAIAPYSYLFADQA